MDEMNDYLLQQQTLQNELMLHQEQQHQQQQQLHQLLVSTSSWSSSVGSVVLDDENTSIDYSYFCASSTGGAPSNNDDDVTQNSSSSSSSSSAVEYDHNASSQMVVEPIIEQISNNILDVTTTNPNIELWQYLLECLGDRRLSHMIRWTTNTTMPASSPTPPSDSTTPSDGYRRSRSTSDCHANEFVIMDARELAKRWARVKRQQRRRQQQQQRNDDELDIDADDDEDAVNVDSSDDVNEQACLQRFNRILRYYVNKKHVLHKLVGGKPNTYVFLIDIQPYLREMMKRRRTPPYDNMLI